MYLFLYLHLYLYLYLCWEVATRLPCSLVMCPLPAQVTQSGHHHCICTSMLLCMFYMYLYYCTVHQTYSVLFDSASNIKIPCLVPTTVFVLYFSISCIYCIYTVHMVYMRYIYCLCCLLAP